MANLAQDVLFISACAFLFGLALFLFRHEIRRRKVGGDETYPPTPSKD